MQQGRVAAGARSATPLAAHSSNVSVGVSRCRGERPSIEWATTPLLTLTLTAALAAST